MARSSFKRNLKKQTNNNKRKPIVCVFWGKGRLQMPPPLRKERKEGRKGRKEGREGGRKGGRKKALQKDFLI
jgi:hypothetical protein